ncbi:MAG: hypothetical protein HY717_08705 [Planctomycetes bacterium]|nr:hypothetical protein [Planctomycetota bacterium]
MKLITAPVHEATGFRLEKPHDRVECRKCHPAERAFAARYPDPALPAYRRRESQCEGCHRDVHEGQFAAAGKGCLDCHARTHFLPAQFGLAQHGTYPLTGAHAAVPCQDCHQVNAAAGTRQFAATARECKACHADPHGGQFSRELAAGDCSQCHRGDASTFKIQPFDHERLANYALTGAHAQAACESCHRELPGSGAAPGARRYRNTDRECAACHRDVHLGQFKDDGKVLCDSCHPSTTTWKELDFDHNRQSRFPLDGVHAMVACQDCHPRVQVAENRFIIQYKPLGVECRDCHGFVKR